jgi:hypothetical protein
MNDGHHPHTLRCPHCGGRLDRSSGQEGWNQTWTWDHARHHRADFTQEQHHQESLHGHDHRRVCCCYQFSR